MNIIPLFICIFFVKFDCKDLKQYDFPFMDNKIIWIELNWILEVDGRRWVEYLCASDPTGSLAWHGTVPGGGGGGTQMIFFFWRRCASWNPEMGVLTLKGPGFFVYLKSGGGGFRPPLGSRPRSAEKFWNLART